MGAHVWWRDARQSSSLTPRKRSAFAITDTELRLIAAPAIIVELRLVFQHAEENNLRAARQYRRREKTADKEC